MRICVVQSSYEGSNSMLEANDPMPDPGLYADISYHQFEQRLIRKFAEKEDIDSICEEKFDIYMNFMWGQLNDNVSGVEATRYLESKGVPIMLSPSDFIAKTKLDFQEAAQDGAFKVPTNTPKKFPKIVKYVDGLASMGMDYDSVCYSYEQLDKKVQLLEAKEPTRKVMVQDFIRGRESTAIVIEMGSEVFALAPVDWVFDSRTPTDKAWLTYSNKFEALGDGSIHFEFVEDGPRKIKLCTAAVAAFKALGMQGHGGWGRVDMRCEENTGDVYCLELNHMPSLFYSEDNKLSDDVIIRETFPGGHEAFIEMLLFTKKLQIAHSKSSVIRVQDHKDLSSIPSALGQIGHMKATGTTIAEVYDSAVDSYDNSMAESNYRAWQNRHFTSHDYSGTVLDLACGTGRVGITIHQAHPSATISGIDISAQSLQTPQVIKHYKQPSRVGYLQEEIMKFEANSFDHVVCFGSLHFLNRTNFMATVSRMFMVAKKSVTFDVDDVMPEYIEAILKCYGEGLRNYNHMHAIQRFGIPKGWRKTVDEYIPLYHSPSVHMDVSGCVLYFQRV